MNCKHNRILYFSGTNREDYRIIDSKIINSLIKKDVTVDLLLGPNNTKIAGDKFFSNNHYLIDEIKKNNITAILFIKGIIPYCIQLFKKKASLYKNPKKTWTMFCDFVRFRSFIISLSIKCVVGIKYGSAETFVIAANSIGLPTIAIQHADYYNKDYSHKRLHEWPVSILILSNKKSKEFVESRFNKRNNYFEGAGPLWVIRYDKKPPKKKFDIVIYESSQHELYIDLIELILERFYEYNIYIKPHPYLERKQKSLVFRYFPNNIYREDLWDSLPYLGISLGSTITDELIYLGSPCVTVLKPSASKELQARFPSTGTFILTESSLANIVDYTFQLVESEQSYNLVLSNQQNERMLNHYSANEVLSRIADIVQYAINDPSQYGDTLGS